MDLLGLDAVLDDLAQRRHLVPRPTVVNSLTGHNLGHRRINLLGLDAVQFILPMLTGPLRNLHAGPSRSSYQPY